MERGGFQSTVGVPLIKDGVTVGVILPAQRLPNAFESKQITLVETFAAQAVIVIQNARLFSETQAVLARQTASADILGVISASPTDTKPVFEAIETAATDLIDSDMGMTCLSRSARI